MKFSESLEAYQSANPDVTRVMRDTPRHLFASKLIQPLAYGNNPVPLAAGATITQPGLVAFMTELLEPSKVHRALEIGTGSGYQTAILAQLVGHVYTIEIRPELVNLANANLRAGQHCNVTQREADGFHGWPEEAPFDRIILTAASSEIPPALVDQLARRGRLVAPVGGWGQQRLTLIEKAASGEMHFSYHGPVAFVPMIR